ncbi:2OG-Fe(II) oxygenase [Acetobacter sp.]|uniref:2OG-Fe(II) oxygenase n=1 Tax=Acetobacter sp. TaxID=440 RepID=UPI0039EB0BB2
MTLSAVTDTEEVGAEWCAPSFIDVASACSRYQMAKPFPYLVLDNLFDTNDLQEIIEKIKEVSAQSWEPHYTQLQKKRVIQREADMPCAVAEYFRQVHSAAFCHFLKQVTGEVALVADPELWGGGVHEVDSNGHFEIHVDFQVHPIKRMKNTVVVITYLNPEWEEGDGGELELWDARTRRREVRIAPLFGRTLIMSQSSIALHGYPSPLKSGKRRALISYFYRPAQTSSDPFLTNTHYLRHTGLPLDRQIHMLLRDHLPQPVISALRHVQSRLVHRWKQRG